MAVDKVEVQAGLATIQLYFEIEADNEGKDGGNLMTHWANICADALELIETQAERIAIMETEGSRNDQHH